MTMEVIVKDKTSYLDKPTTQKLDLDIDGDESFFRDLYGQDFLNYIRGLKSGGMVEVLITWRD